MGTPLTQTPVTWQDVAEIADEAIEMYRHLINSDPEHGVLWTQRMAVMLLRKSEVMAAIHREEHPEIFEGKQS